MAVAERTRQARCIACNGVCQPNRSWTREEGYTSELLCQQCGRSDREPVQIVQPSERIKAQAAGVPERILQRDRRGRIMGRTRLTELDEVIDGVTMRACRVCSDVLPLNPENFATDRGQYMGKCRPCKRAKRRIFYRDELREIQILKDTLAARTDDLLTLSNRTLPVGGTEGKRLTCDDRCGMIYARGSIVFLHSPDTHERAGIVAARTETSPTLRFQDIEIYPPRMRVTVAGRVVYLSNTEYRILETLAMRRGMIVTAAEIIRQVWGQSYALDVQANCHMVRVNISRLRKLLGGGTHRYIQTHPGEGYYVL